MAHSACLQVNYCHHHHQHQVLAILRLKNIIRIPPEQEKATRPIGEAMYYFVKQYIIIFIVNRK